MATEHDGQELARTAAAVTAAVSGALAQLEAVLAAQRRGIVALAAVGKLEVELPSVAPIEVNVPKDMPRGADDRGGDAAGLAGAALCHAAAHAIGLALYNAVAAQQQLQVLAQAVTAQAAARVLAERK